jgi:hypothetical protein
MVRPEGRHSRWQERSPGRTDGTSGQLTSPADRGAAVAVLVRTLYIHEFFCYIRIKKILTSIQILIWVPEGKS